MQEKRGFTLIELLVVVLIIGILSAVALPQYQGAVDKARFSKTYALMDSIVNAQDVYYMANGTYSLSWEDLDIKVGTPRGEDSLYLDVSKGLYCYIGGDASYGGCGYSIKSGCRVLYLTYWKSRRFNCYASSSCERANKVCKSVTGKTNYSVVGEDNVYVF